MKRVSCWPYEQLYFVCHASLLPVSFSCRHPCRMHLINGGFPLIQDDGCRRINSKMQLAVMKRLPTDAWVLICDVKGIEAAIIWQGQGHSKAGVTCRITTMNNYH